jgi:hypothetical protein
MCTEQPGVNRHIPGKCYNETQLINQVQMYRDNPLGYSA